MTTQAERTIARGGLSRLAVSWLSLFRYLIVTASVWFAVTGLIPFTPYQIVGYRAIPAKGCPGEVIEVHLMRQADKPLLGWINRVDLDIRWQNIDTGVILLSATPSDVFNGGYGYDSDALGVLNVSPDRSGHWRIVTTATVQGVKMLMPNKQTIVHTTKQVYELLPKSHPSCRRKLNG